MSDSRRAMRVRPMSAADIARVLDIAGELAGAPQWAESTYIAAIDPQNRPPRTALIAAGPDDVIAGFVIASLVPPEAELESIAVAAESQRSGIGRLLMSELKSRLLGEEVTELMLEVRSSNQAAIDFYGTLGFKESGRRPVYYADPEEDALLMHLRIA